MTQPEHFCHACGASIDPRAEICPKCGVRQRTAIPMASEHDAVLRDANGKKIAAGICGVLIGAFGIHKFLFGATTPGLIMLLGTVCTCGIGGIAMGIIGLVEGIIYLTKSDADFHNEYIVGKKGWF